MPDPMEGCWVAEDGQSHILIMWEDDNLITIDVWDCPRNEWNPDSDPPVGKVIFGERFKLLRGGNGDAR